MLPLNVRSVVTGFVLLNIHFWKGKLKVRRNVEYVAIDGRLTAVCVIKNNTK
jgi:hypothetical protein